ncbi:hypothetical protein HanXRQr2_Chr17g0825721 [Helianthus annuus]|uniref:Uncharacterized protein n=1 Tax=Helianthus annuus TaxID=4232 RepID=A0A9K3DKT0_HELAN|nr:hypothetical protein HanXRQr2_Chr17g0825721 [Helianthus annuus]
MIIINILLMLRLKRVFSQTSIGEKSIYYFGVSLKLFTKMMFHFLFAFSFN